MEIPAQWIRGGTSKCWVFEDSDIAATGYGPDDLLPRIFGSPDHRQIDGVGGASSTTSKAMILTEPQEDDLDVIFRFAQVGIEEPVVDWGSNCGNCSTTAGLYAVENGWVELAQDVTVVRTYNTNTGQRIIQRIPTPGGSLPAAPQAHIPGTVHPGHEVGLGFVDPAGKTTGHLLPTGQARSTLQIDGRGFPVTLIDAGAPAVFLPAAAVELAEVAHKDWSDAVGPMLGTLDALRRAAAVAMGMAESPEQAERAVPKLGIVGPPRHEGADLEVLMLSMGAPHPAMPITGGVAVTTAAFTPGTFPHELARDATSGSLAPDGVRKLRLATPAGGIVTFFDESGTDLVVGADRTARRLATATLYLPDSL